MRFACIQSETKVNVGKSTCANGQNIVAPAGHTQLADFAQSEPRTKFLRYNKYFISLTRVQIRQLSSYSPMAVTPKWPLIALPDL